MNSSLLDDFQIVQSPVSNSCRLNFDEFNSACTPLQAPYCSQMTEDEFERIGESETELQLKSLVDHLNKNPDDLIKVLRKRKIEELENAGFYSFVKHKVMSKLRGDDYVNSLLSSADCQQQLSELTNGMLVVHNYSKETKRQSARLAEKRAAAQLYSDGNCSSTATPVLTRRPIRSAVCSASNCDELGTIPSVPKYLPPPPPPPPLPSCLQSAISKGPTVSPMKEHNGLITKSLKLCAAKLKKTSATRLRSNVEAAQEDFPSENVNRPDFKQLPSSKVAARSLQEELMLSDPVKRLRSTQVPRSPGGTPIYNANDKQSWKSALDSPEPLHAALVRILEQKFRNIRSPSPASSVVNSPNAQPFSP